MGSQTGRWWRFQYTETTKNEFEDVRSRLQHTLTEHIHVCSHNYLTKTAIAATNPEHGIFATQLSTAGQHTHGWDRHLVAHFISETPAASITGEQATAEPNEFVEEELGSAVAKDLSCEIEHLRRRFWQ